ncbi:GNAT family N-acetyltransferase [Niveibacterium umoris]|uniref:RimJ/RimL family protein N-acetyltransferase n=1 Tax=Niveibacterium umoris TaxID=1193620 RepID=A0A840BG84_9RHOO|nr:GNAT family N-acetyltransferase [Niveibacterium umoris]MBB4012020.1 RimJ/RimL family protein N-acetyltransferase [Niveibacterium umoris]
MLIPTLRTERLELIPPDSTCDSAYQHFYTDAEASAAYGGPLSPAAAWSRLAYDIGAWYLQGFGVWALRRHEDAAVLGVCGFWQGRGWPRELTWWLLPEARGRGYAVEASLAVVKHAYVKFGWEAVHTYCADANEAAKALILRLGGVQVARQVFPDGEHRNVYLIPRPAA